MPSGRKNRILAFPFIRRKTDKQLKATYSKGRKMKNKTLTSKSSHSRKMNRRGFFILWIALVVFWPTPTLCQEFSAIIKEINNLESKLTRIVQNEATQRKASDSAIVKAIGKTPAMQPSAHDSAIFAEINHIKILVAANNVKTDTVVKSLAAIQCRVDSLVKTQPDARVVELATMLQQIVDDLKKELSVKTAPAPATSQIEVKKPAEAFKPKTDIGGLVYAQYSYDASVKPSLSNDGFSITRAYVDIKEQFAENIAGRITLDLDSKATTYKYAFLKYAYADYSILSNSLTFRLGQQETPWIGFVDKAWKYRSIEKTLNDYNGVLSSADIGAAVMYKFPRNYGELVTQVINGDSYKNATGIAENNVQKDFAGRLSINPLPANAWGKGLAASIGFQYKNSSNAPSAVSTGLVSYENPLLSAGIECLGATIRDSVTKVVSMRTTGVSIFGDVSAPFFSRAGLLARYDSYNPDDKIVDNGSSLIIAGARYCIHAKHTAALVYEQSAKQKSGTVPVKLVKIVLESKF
jgi:hypothetical protein